MPKFTPEEQYNRWIEIGTTIKPFLESVDPHTLLTDLPRILRQAEVLPVENTYTLSSMVSLLMRRRPELSSLQDLETFAELATQRRTSNKYETTEPGASAGMLGLFDALYGDTSDRRERPE